MSRGKEFANAFASWPLALGGRAPAAEWLGVEADGAGRVKVGARLTPPGSDDIFVIGDTALALDANGKPLPGLAPVAKQQGVYVTEVIKARLAGKTDVPPFRYRDRGKLATIGRRAAIIAFGRLRLKGGLPGGSGASPTSTS